MKILLLHAQFSSTSGFIDYGMAGILLMATKQASRWIIITDGPAHRPDVKEKDSSLKIYIHKLTWLRVIFILVHFFS